MSDFLNRTTLEFRRSVNDPDYADPPWLLVPPGSNNRTLIDTVPRRYLTLTGDVLSEMSQAEKDAVDAQLLSDQRDETANQFDDVDGITRSFALVVLDEINALRAEHALAPRTISQMKSAVRNKLGT